MAAMNSVSQTVSNDFYLKIELWLLWNLCLRQCQRISFSDFVQKKVRKDIKDSKRWGKHFFLSLFKGSLTRDFQLQVFFSWIGFPRAPEYPIRTVRFFSKVRWYILLLLLFAYLILFFKLNGNSNISYCLINDHTCCILFDFSCVAQEMKLIILKISLQI